MKYSVFSPEKLEDVLSLLERSVNTNRTKETWFRNNLTAVLAYDGDALVGAIPLEPREFDIGNGKTIKVLWITRAHVDPEYRSKGIGGHLYSFIKESFFPAYKGVFVYRADENSRAYKWYRNLGLQPLLPILSLYSKFPAKKITKFSVFSTSREIESQAHNIIECSRDLATSPALGGVSVKSSEGWFRRISCHYYKESYKFYLVTVPGSNKMIESYALLGETSMRDKVYRVDILEHCAPDNSNAREKLFSAIECFACDKTMMEVRIQLSANDEIVPWLRERGFLFRWRTNILGALINPQSYLRLRLQSFLKVQEQIALSVESPSSPSQLWGAGGQKTKLFLSDCDFQRLLLNRCDLMNSLHEGRSVILEGNEEIISNLAGGFPFQGWRHHQVDYI